MAYYNKAALYFTYYITSMQAIHTMATTTTRKRSLLLSLLFVLCVFATSSLATKVKTAPVQNQKDGEAADSGSAAEKCRWGEPCSNTAGGAAGGMSGSNSLSANSSTQQPNQEAGSANNKPSSASITNNLPFVKSKINTPGGQKQSHTTTPGGQQQHYIPPEGFHVDARVYTDPNDQLAHFDEEGSLLLLPYFDCATTGITTLPLKLQHGYFRHTISSQTQPSSFEGSEFFVQHDNAAAILLITLHPTSSLTVELDSGEQQSFGPGSVILLEDVVAGGHKCTSLDGQDVTVLLLTLPPHYVTAKKASQNQYCLSILRPTPKIRRSILMGLGAATSLLLADWLGKVAPIWLSVGIGGGCLVVGGTFGFVKSSESLLDQVEVYRERRRYSTKHQQAQLPEEASIRGENDENANLD